MERAQDYGHIRALDGIRGFALIAVFAYHALTYTIAPSSHMGSRLQRIAETGWVGVDLFFVLSGFLITTILLDARAAKNYFRVFYIRRGLRIFPLYYLVLAGSLLLEPGHSSWRAQLFYWLNLSNLPTAFRPYVIPYLAHFWSLAIEEQFYLVWPSLVRWVRARTLATICAATIVGLFLLRNLPVILALNRRWPEFVYRLTPFRVDTLCAGALLAIVVQRWPDLSRHRKYLRLVCVLSGGLFLHAGFGQFYTATAVVRYGYTSLVVCFASLVALALYPKGITSRVFSLSLLRKTGKYSYCFYLLHPFLVNYVAAHDEFVRATMGRLGLGAVPHNLVELIVAAAEFWLIFAACALSWSFFEGPILRLKRHVRYTPAPEHYLA